MILCKKNMFSLSIDCTPPFEVYVYTDNIADPIPSAIYYSRGKQSNYLITTQIK